MLNNSDSLFLPKSSEERKETEEREWRVTRAQRYRRWSHVQPAAYSGCLPGFSIWWTSCSHVRTRVRWLAFTHRQQPIRYPAVLQISCGRSYRSRGPGLILSVYCLSSTTIYQLPGYFWDCCFPKGKKKNPWPIIPSHSLLMGWSVSIIIGKLFRNCSANLSLVNLSFFTRIG